MRVLVVGGDGYCGWPTALRLSARGMAVGIVDNFSRRRIDRDLDLGSLTPVATLDERLAVWEACGGAPISGHEIDLAEDYESLARLISSFRPDAVVHFAAQRAVPYAMMSATAGLYTIRNNLMVTNNLLTALAETGVEAHLVHLGSIGVYGYETLGYEIPEGYLPVRQVMPDGELGPTNEVLHPFNPVSKYHLTKALDHLSLAYFAASHGVRVTDLHQGTVWGAETPETSRDPRLANRFDYDTVYGTVLNRFAVQAALGLPISIYGAGEQTRGFIHLEDVLACVEGALASAPRTGERVRVVNQIAQSMRIKDLAKVFAEISESEILHIPSPRAEPVENELIANNAGVKAFGVTPTLISGETVSGLVELVRSRAGAVDTSLLYPGGGSGAGAQHATGSHESGHAPRDPAASAHLGKASTVNPSLSVG